MERGGEGTGVDMCCHKGVETFCGVVADELNRLAYFNRDFACRRFRERWLRRNLRPSL